MTRSGVLGSLVYAASALIRDAIETHGQAPISLDLAPDRSQAWLTGRMERPRGGRSLANHPEKTVGIRGLKAGLLYEFILKADLQRPDRIAEFIKKMPIPLVKPRPLNEAISSAGGVAFEALDPHLMLRSYPGVFCAGEMLDWEAPTGGYLLTLCFASGRAAGLGAVNWLRQFIGP